MNKIYIVGMGPGFESMMTKQAIDWTKVSLLLSLSAIMLTERK